VSFPDLTQHEREYLLAAFDSTWIASTGEFVTRFESDFARFVGTRHAITCVNGTAALHLTMLALGIGEGDEVILPDLTYVATANAVRYLGATPVLADCDQHTWTIDPASVRRLITPRTRAVVAVHLFGVPADMTGLQAIANEFDLSIVEDAAEAHGAQWNGRPVGSLGSVSAFSFYGNKIITTGEGGAVCTDRDDIAEKVRLLRGQGMAPGRRYWFPEIGHNYRMTNLCCAIGVAQLERFAEMHGKRESVRWWYEDALADRSLPIQCQQIPELADPVLWILAIVLGEGAADRDRLTDDLQSCGIETRPFFHPLHQLPPYRDCPTDNGCPIATTLAARGVMLPTHTRLTQDDIRTVVDELSACLCQRIEA
jgi:perosamine synthetase